MIRPFRRSRCCRRRSASSSTTSSTAATSSTVSKTTAAAFGTAAFALSSFIFFRRSACCFLCSCSAASFLFRFCAAFASLAFSFACCCFFFSSSEELESELEELSEPFPLPFFLVAEGLMIAFRRSSSRRLSRLRSRSRSRSSSRSLWAVPGLRISRRKASLPSNSGPPPLKKVASSADFPEDVRDMEIPSAISLPMKRVATAGQKLGCFGANFATV
mmetsp:Transcript_11545/g.26831  ORF Transcript_11545/g.26831 Transcript_11545/m.26831 type:complete len:217 (+) Transcript_11545:159-809(+)